jgi:hypothetical protein
MDRPRNRHARRVAGYVAAGLCAVIAGTFALASVYVPGGRNVPKVSAQVSAPTPTATPTATATATDGPPTPPSFSGCMMGFPRFKMTTPILTEMAVNSDGAVPADEVRRIVRLKYGRLRLCYESGLKHDATLRGTVAARFVIDSDGTVFAAEEDEGSSLPDGEAVDCVIKTFRNLTFPSPTRRAGFVTYRLRFEPGS